MIETAASFRDPEGFCCELDRRIFRFVEAKSADRIEELLASKFFRDAFTNGVLPATRVLELSEANAVAGRLGYSLPDGTLVLEHDRVPFPSYPAEWCPEMLFSAGELTLDLQLRALASGLTLKDATPDNLLFRGATPVFVDLLSFATRPSGSVLWPAYGQFVRTFLLPLLLHRQTREPLAEIFLTRRDGLEPEDVYRRTSWLGRLSPTVFTFATLATWLGRRNSTQKLKLEAADRPQDPARALFISEMVLKSLRKSFSKLRPPTTVASAWSQYMESHTYSPEALAAKEEFVRSALSDLKPRAVLDVGCNTGHFSRMAAKEGCQVVSIDYDPAVTGRVWQQSKANGQTILPLVVNLARPTPAMGWRNREQKSFLERANHHFDTVLLLAVLHHLTISEGVPLGTVFQLLHDLGPTHLIIEHVGPADSMVQRLILNKEHLLPRLTLEAFEQAYASRFELVRRQALPGSQRTLYTLRRR